MAQTALDQLDKCTELNSQEHYQLSAALIGKFSSVNMIKNRIYWRRKAFNLLRNDIVRN